MHAVLPSIPKRLVQLGQTTAKINVCCGLKQVLAILRPGLAKGLAPELLSFGAWPVLRRAMVPPSLVRVQGQSSTTRKTLFTRYIYHYAASWSMLPADMV